MTGDRRVARLRAQSADTGGIGGDQTGQIRTFDVTDPVTVAEFPPPEPIAVALRDIAGDGGLLAVTTMPRAMFANGGIVSGPAQLLVYDIAGGTPAWTGAATLANSVEDSVPTRVVVKEEVAYVATWRKGIQVVDLTRTGTPTLVSAPD